MGYISTMCTGDLAQSHTVLSTQKKSVLRLTCSGEGSYEEHTYEWQEAEVVPPGSGKVWG